jgi:hypothetical protein
MQTEKLVLHLVNLLGGREKGAQAIRDHLDLFNKKWNTNIEITGRILRAHLFVEHFLTDYLQAQNPNLGSLEDARLSFTQKLLLVDEKKSVIVYLLPGIKRINTIRNRVAHSLEATITKEDRDLFLSIDFFVAMRNEEAKYDKRKLSFEPLDVMEEFSLFAGSALQQSPVSLAIAEAIRLATEEV